MTPSTRRLGVGALIGLLAAAVSVGFGELIAALVRPAAAPIIAVGNRLILLTPEPVKRWAIGVFGTGDKRALLTGIYLAIALVAMLIGLLAVRRLAAGLVGIGLLGLFGGYCALTVPAHHGSDAVPSLLGAAAGLVALTALHRSVVAAPATPIDQAGSGPARTDRRRFLQGGLTAAALAAITGFGGRALQRNRFDATAARARTVLPPAVSVPTEAPGVRPATFDLGKSGVPFRTPSKDFYRIDTALAVPQLDPKTWSLRIHGKVANELTLTFAELVKRPLVERWVTLTCVSNEIGGNLIGTALFRGVLLADLLREARIDPAADQLLATSSDGMTIGSPTAVVLDGRDAMLAIGMNGEPLPVEHGFPVRMVVPGLYGYVSACKWITQLEATTFAEQQAYWVQGGWAARGPVKLASRIDRPSNSQRLTAGQQVAVAGVAWDQHVGVSRVEVQVDSGSWQPATLAPVPSTDTWRQWVYLWTPTAAGRHLLRVRAYDAAGQVQQSAAADPFPSGASGLHTVSVSVK